jgi:phosphoribosylamine-glycine ligase
MKAMETFKITAHMQDAAQIEAVKAFMKALKIKFEIIKDKPYNPEFVQKIVTGDDDYKAGKGRKVTIEELNKLWK